MAVSGKKLTNRESGDTGARSAGGNGADELRQLRQMIVRPEDIGEVLPKAVEERDRKDGELREATLPIVEENIRQSATRNPKVLTEALFPIIGPAIRKAISEALSSMVQSFNQTLEYSVSPKSVRWRLEAYRTGKSFGEVVMLKTLLYRVEQVFLVHRETGLLLQHVAANPEDIEDADMVSAMLTAIGDFVQDSFKPSDDATLDALKIKELSVWVETGPDAFVAAVIRGNPPLTFRETLLEAIEKIEFEHERDLDAFSGESHVFERSRPVLEKCLQSRSNVDEEEEKGGFLNPATVVLGVLGLLILVAGFFYVRDHLRWSGYLEQLRAEKGIVVVETDRGFFTHRVSGLRDPLAADPAALLAEHGYEPDDVEQVWRPFEDADPEFVLRRAGKLLRPPEGVELKLENRVLTASAEAPAEWLEESSRLAPFLAGVDELRPADGGFAALERRIEAVTLFFECNTADLADGEERKLEGLAADLDRLFETGTGFDLGIRGSATSTGSPETNMEISRRRAETVLAGLARRSEKIGELRAEGNDPVRILAGDGGAEECKVTLEVTKR